MNKVNEMTVDVYNRIRLLKLTSNDVILSLSDNKEDKIKIYHATIVIDLSITSRRCILHVTSASYIHRLGTIIEFSALMDPAAYIIVELKRLIVELKRYME